MRERKGVPSRHHTSPTYPPSLSTRREIKLSYSCSSSNRPHPPHPLSMGSTFETLVARLTRDANRAQPRDPLQWCSNWFQQRLEEQRARSRSELVRLPSYRTSLPNDRCVDPPIQSNRQPIWGSADQVLSYPRVPPRHLPSPPDLRDPGPFGTLNVPGNALLEGGKGGLPTPPLSANIEPNPPVGPMSSSDLYSTYQSTNPSPVPGQSSPFESRDNLLYSSPTIPVRQTPGSAESIAVNSETIEPPPVFPETIDRPRRIRNSIASNFIFRDPDAEEQETEELDDMQEVRVGVDDVVIRQGDIDEHSDVGETGHLDRYIRPEPLPPWQSGKHSTASLPLDEKFLHSPSPLLRSANSSPGPTANSFVDPQLLYGVCGFFGITLELSVVDNLVPFPSQRSGSTHLRSPAPRRRSRVGSQMSSPCRPEDLCPSASRRRTGVIC